MATLKEQRDAANKWAAQEKADIEAGRKTPPITSKEKIMSTKSFNDLGATGSNPLPPRTTKMATIKSQETVNFSLIEDTGASTKAQGLKHRALTRALRERRAALRGDPQKANAVQALSGEEKAAVDAAAKAEVERVRADVKARKEATVKARTITDEELFSGQSREPIGQGRKDLGRSVTRSIRAGQEGDTELLKIARRRSTAGRSIAGPDPAKPPTMAARARAARAAGKVGGRLGMYGAIMGALEGAQTLRKLKTGAYDMTVEGGAKLKKGHVES